MTSRSSPHSFAVFSGQFENVHADTLNHVPILMLEIRLSCPKSAPGFFLRATDNGFVLILEGSVEIGAGLVALPQGQPAGSHGPTQNSPQWLWLRSREAPCRLLLFSGSPLRKPVVFGGPFVMNTREEIQQAPREFDRPVCHIGFHGR